MREFFAWMADIKQASADQGGSVHNIHVSKYSSGSAWLAFLDESVLARLDLPNAWPAEEMLETILRSEYLLVSLDLAAEGGGELRYYPTAYPFGGTDALKAFVKMYGYTVTKDSLHEMFCEQISKQDPRTRSKLESLLQKIRIWLKQS